MKLSTKGRYGLRIMVELATRFGKGPIVVDIIAESQGLSAKYIHVLMGGLRNAGLINTIRGPRGGYELAKAPQEISALDVVVALEGSITPVGCVGMDHVCEFERGCVTRQVWEEMGHAIEETLRRYTLQTLAIKQLKLRGGDPNMFYI